MTTESVCHKYDSNYKLPLWLYPKTYDSKSRKRNKSTMIPQFKITSKWTQLNDY